MAEEDRRQSPGRGGVAEDRLQQRRMMSYCRFCLIKFDQRFLIELFQTNSQRLEQQIRMVLTGLKLDKEDSFSRCICIECAMKITTSFNFLEFCLENQRLLRSSYFNEQLLVESIDLTATSDAPPPPLTQMPHRLSEGSPKLSTPNPPPSNGLPSLNSVPPPHPQSVSVTTPPPDEDDSVGDQEEDEDGQALSSMVECQLEDGEEEPSANAGEALALVSQPPNPYRCSVCFREFGKKANVLSHFQTQHTSLEVPSAWKYEIEPAKCPICGHLVECLLAHLELHAGKRPFKCDSCEWAFYSKNYLTIHAAKLHKADALVDANPDRFTCKLCPQAPPLTLSDYDALVVHYRQWHLNEAKNQLERCHLCGRETRYMKVHMQKCHKDPNREQPFQCHFCPKKYAQARYLQSHLTQAHSDHLPTSSLAIQQPPPQNSLPMDYSMAAAAAGVGIGGQMNGHSKEQHPQTKQRTTATVDPNSFVQCVKCHMQFPNNRLLNMHINRYHLQPPAIVTSRGTVVPPIEAAPPAAPSGRKRGKGTGGGAQRKRKPSGEGGGMHPPQQKVAKEDIWNSSMTGMWVNMFSGGQAYET